MNGENESQDSGKLYVARKPGGTMRRRNSLSEGPVVSISWLLPVTTANGHLSLGQGPDTCCSPLVLRCINESGEIASVFSTSDASRQAPKGVKPLS